jgi:hypothetical protein
VLAGSRAADRDLLVLDHLREPRWWSGSALPSHLPITVHQEPAGLADERLDAQIAGAKR